MKILSKLFKKKESEPIKPLIIKRNSAFLNNLSTPRGRYIAATVKFADALSKIAYLTMLKEEGNLTEDDKKTLPDLVATLKDAREHFLSTQKEMGYTTGENFIEDAHFRGFYLHNGLLHGDTDLLHMICYPWFNDFINGKSNNNFQFEVASYLIALEH